jgi:predicted phage baseplate assembly protein
MLPAPNLDDRDFQQLVDDAKRLVQQRCPSWTDHNVSDPGVTLIEAVAQMIDQLIYRLNRVPDLNYIKFLELIGVELRPPAASRGQVTFWLSAPQPQTVLVRSESQVATPRTDISDPVVFSTTRQLDIVPCSFVHALVQPNRSPGPSPMEDRTLTLGREPRPEFVERGESDPQRGFEAFSKVPVVGDAMMVGLSAAVPSCAVLLRFNCPVSGEGIDPRRPPRVWEAWTDEGWVACEVGEDGTGGLNKPGDVVLHVPDNHQAWIPPGFKPADNKQNGWLRCRLIEPAKDKPFYRKSPRIYDIEAHTIGGTAPMVNAEVVRSEVLGRSDGTPAQTFPLQRRPVVASDAPLSLTVLAGEDEQQWTEVRHFALSGADDRHFRVDAYAGEVQFGPAIRGARGELIRHGEIPPRGAALRLEAYQAGGGQAGNVARGQVRLLKTSIPYVSRVENRIPAIGGAEAETLSNAKARGPLLLRSRGRAVTAEDFEELARDVAPDAARVRCIPEAGATSGVRVLVVPHAVSDEVGQIERADLDPPWQVLERISNSLDERRLVGTRLIVQPPEYLWLTAIVDLSARAKFDPDKVHTDVLRALYHLYHPLVGGPDGTGWPFGRSVQSHEVHAALARIPGVDMSRELRVKLYPAEADTGKPGSAVERMDLPETGLVYSFDHQVRVTR